MLPLYKWPGRGIMHNINILFTFKVTLILRGVPYFQYFMKYNAFFITPHVAMHLANLFFFLFLIQKKV